MRDKRQGWLMLAPTLIILFVVGLLPFLYVLYVGFFQWNVFSAEEGMQFIGLDNYRRLVFDGPYLESIWITVKFTFFAVVSELVLGYFLAQMLMRDFPGKAIFRVIHTLPIVIAPIAVGAIWRLLAVPGLGPVPYFLDRWFDFDFIISANANQAFLTTVLMDVWHWTPFVTLTLLSGLLSIPREPLEQAQVDGANRLQVFMYITLPYMRPVILSTLFIRIMDSLRIVDEVWMLTGGGPGAATRYIGLHIWREVFPKTSYGYGSAMSLLTLYFTIVLCWLLFVSITRSDDVE